MSGMYPNPGSHFLGKLTHKQLERKHTYIYKLNEMTSESKPEQRITFRSACTIVYKRFISTFTDKLYN
jgi:hypothetical protein